MRHLGILAGIGLLLAVTGTAGAATVFFSNYALSSDNSDSWNDTANPVEVVEDFTTDTNDPGQWQVSSLTISAYGGGLLGGGSSPVNINMYENNSGVWGDQIFALTNVTVDGSACGDDNTYAVSGLVLDADTSYWLGIEALGGSSEVAGWRRTTDSIFGSDPMTGGSGYTWDGGGHVFKIEGVAVPEPATVALLALGGAFALIRRRRK